MSSPECLPDLLQLVCLDSSESDEHDESGVGSRSLLDQTMPAIVFDPDSDGCPTSTQIPVVFSGLEEGAKDCVSEDSPLARALFLTENVESPVKSEEEVVCFDLVSSSNEGEPIPSSQPHYSVQDMWW